MEMRPPSRTFRLSTKPSFSLPSSCVGGRRQFSKITSPVALARRPSLFSFLPQAEAGRALFDDEGGDAVLRGGAVGDRHGHADIGVVRVGGEGLGAVEHPASPSSSTAVVRVPAASRAGFGFGERPAADPLARGQLGEVALALLVGAHLVDVVGAERSVRGDDDAHRAIHARELLDDDGVLDVAQAGAAQFLREDGAHVAELAELADDFEREDLRLVPLHDVRARFRLRRIPGRPCAGESVPACTRNPSASPRPR